MHDATQIDHDSLEQALIRADKLIELTQGYIGKMALPAEFFSDFNEHCLFMDKVKRAASVTDRLRRVGELEAERDAIRAQLPEGMEHCTIRFKECKKGHGRLTAANWIDTGCPWCEIDRLRKELGFT